MGRSNAGNVFYLTGSFLSTARTNKLSQQVHKTSLVIDVLSVRSSGGMLAYIYVFCV